MKRIFLLLMSLFIQQTTADDFALCYLYKIEASNSTDWTRQGPVPGSYLLFDKDHYNQSFEKTIDGVTFYLQAISTTNATEKIIDRVTFYLQEIPKCAGEIDAAATDNLGELHLFVSASKCAIESGAAVTDNPGGYLYVSVLPSEGGSIITKDKQAYVRTPPGTVSKIGAIKIADLGTDTLPEERDILFRSVINIFDRFDWKDTPKEETGYYMWPSSKEEDIEKAIKAKCETLSEKEAIVRTFNRVHQQSD